MELSSQSEATSGCFFDDRKKIFDKFYTELEQENEENSKDSLHFPNPEDYEREQDFKIAVSESPA